MSSPGDNTQGFPTNSSPVVDANNGLRWTQPWLQFMITLWRRTGTANGGATSPTGMIMGYGSTTPPSGWVLCDGTALDRTIYAALFSVVGTNFGAGNGSTTFNVPNLTNRFPIGFGPIAIGSRGGNVAYSSGNTGAGYAAIAFMIKT